MACEDQRLSEQGAGGSEILKVGDRFMVLDCGGGTVDITMHQVEATKPLRLSEICAPDGGPFGSTFVDHAFEKFVQELMGLECWNRFKPSAAWGEILPCFLCSLLCDSWRILFLARSEEQRQEYLTLKALQLTS